MEVLFYHLTTRPLEAALPGLLEKTLERGWRAVIRAEPERVEMLNRHLWTYRQESFLPHGTAGEGHSELQPVFLTSGPDTPNMAEVCFLLDGTSAKPEAMRDYERVCILFSGADPAATDQARALWRTVSEAGLKAVYWQQTDKGGWQKKSDKEET